MNLHVQLLDCHGNASELHAFAEGDEVIVLAIQRDLGIPIKLVGLGESAADLIAFDPDEFVDALFS